MRVRYFLIWGVMSLPALAAGLEPASSAEHCGACHRAIEEAWKDSSHARAVESRLFQDALEAAETEYGGAVRKTCLGCHAPVAVDTGDLQLVRKVSWEGVTCDFCHSIRGVSLEGVNPRADVKFTLVKTGPLKEAVSGAHATEYSAVHTTSAVCATCHEYRNAMGFPVLTTYSEWEQSRYAKDGTQCQGCHMFRVAGDVVDPKVQRSSEAKINLHQMPGSHSLAQLTSTVRASLAAVHENGRLKITVDVTNHAAGHFVPTGSPLRQITMEVRADTYGGQHYREERVYARKVADQHGNPIEREPQAFLKAAKTLSDTRLGPGETRSEAFSFPVPEGTQSQVKVTFWYFYSPLARVESQKRITFLTLNRLVK